MLNRKGSGSPRPAWLLALWVGLLGASSGAWSASSASSAVLESLGVSIGVSSQAISGVSSSVSPRRADVAAGDYEVRQVWAAQGPATTGPQRLVELIPTGEGAIGGEGDFARSASGPETRVAWRLGLPETTAAAAGIEPGAVVTVQARPYGIHLSRRGQAQPFFLVLHDDWTEALNPRPLDR